MNVEREDRGAPTTEAPPAATNGAADPTLPPAEIPSPAAPAGENGAVPAGVAPSPAPDKSASGGGWRYWVRPIVLAVVAALLGIATLWDQQRIPDTPPPPDVRLATPAPGAAATLEDATLTDTLLRLRAALSKRDARALSGLADPEGLVVAAYGGGLPDGGYNASNAAQLSQEVLSGSNVKVLGWRNDGRGRIIVLTEGWKRRPLHMSVNSTLEQTSLAAIGLVQRNGTWYWHWLLPDPASTLDQQARSMVWQPWPS